MQIDWITVAAQVVNFLILVWLLRHFLYGPVVRAMDKRERHIAERLEEADRKAQEAEADKQAYARERQELDQRREELMTQARRAAEARRKELEKEARAAAEATRAELHAQVERDRERFLRDLRQRIAERFERLARRALGDLADAKLEQQIAEAFCRKVSELDAPERARVAEAATQGDGRLTVLSAHDLPADVRRVVTRKLHETFGEELGVSYHRSDDVLCGIELRAGNRSVLWSLDAYVDEFESRLSETLREMAATPRADAA